MLNFFLINRYYDVIIQIGFITVITWPIDMLERLHIDEISELCMSTCNLIRRCSTMEFGFKSLSINIIFHCEA